MPDVPRYTDEDLVRIAVLAGQRAASHNMEAFKSLAPDGSPPPLVLTKAETEDLVEQVIARALGRIGLPMATDEQQVETTKRLGRLFALEEDSRKFMRRIIWGTVAGVGTLILGALATALKVTGLK